MQTNAGPCANRGKVLKANRKRFNNRGKGPSSKGQPTELWVYYVMRIV